MKLFSILVALNVAKTEKCETLPYRLTGQEWKCNDSGVCTLQCSNGHLSNVPVSIKCICPHESACFYVSKYDHYQVGMDFELSVGFIERSGFDCSIEEQYYPMAQCGSLPEVSTAAAWSCVTDQCVLQCTAPNFTPSLTLRVHCECDVSISTVLLPKV